MKKIVLNGKSFIKKNKRGVQRYTCEIIEAMDKYVKNNDVELLVPKTNIELPKFRHIKVIEKGFINKGWQYTVYQYYILKNRAMGISLSGDVAPFISPGIVAIHDIRFAKEEKEIKSIREFIKNKYNLFIFNMIEKNAKHIITVSDFSKMEIKNYYRHNKNNISVIYNGWEHLKEILIDEKYLKNKYKTIINNSFYFLLGGLEKNKNLKWIYELAKRNKNDLFLMAGPPLSKYNIIDYNIDIRRLKNIIYLGYITDEEMAFFMSKCKAFLFPSLYEGFGIPPLEALYFGARVLCSNSTCLPEIYKDYVTYFDPYDYNVDLDKLLEKPVNKSKEIFDLYSWDKSAKQLLNIIKQYQ